MDTKKAFKKADLIPAFSLLLSVVGAILVACHLLIPGLVVSSLGLIAAIFTWITEKKFGMNPCLSYWAEMLGIVLFIISCLGFAGYTVWDYVKMKDVG